MTTSDILHGLDATLLAPSSISGFRPLIAEALSFFVDRLSTMRKEGIARSFDTPMARTSSAGRLVALMHCCPTLHKLGQVIARHRGLPESLRGPLRSLEMRPLVSAPDPIRQIINQELTQFGVQEDVVVYMGAAIEASVAVVVPILWHHHPSGPAQHGVLKVKKPEIESRLHEELDILEALAAHLDETGAHHGAAALDYRETFQTVRDLLLSEIQFESEQRNLREARHRYAQRRDVQIPRLLPFCSSRMTGMERVFGTRVTAMDGQPAEHRRRMARAIVDALVADVVFSRHRQTVFHADPHAGNLFATVDGRLAILDWSLTGTLGQPHCEAVARVFLAAIIHDAAGMARGLDSLLLKPLDAALMEEVVETSLRDVRQGCIPGPRWLVGLLDHAAMAGARFADPLLLMRKMLLTLEGVIEDVCNDTSIDAILLSKGMETFWAEWPRRAYSWHASRDFETHVSTNDLVRTLVTAPFSIGHCWLRVWRDLYGSAGTRRSISWYPLASAG